MAKKEEKSGQNEKPTTNPKNNIIPFLERIKERVKAGELGEEIDKENELTPQSANISPHDARFYSLVDSIGLTRYQRELEAIEKG